MKFLALCPCDRIIFDKRDTPSLISIIQNVDIAFQAIGEAGQVKPEEKVPANAVVPKEWFIYSRWEASAEDVGKHFEQLWEVYWPNGDKFTEHTIPLKPILKDDHIQHSSLQLMGFPAGQEGMLKVATWLNLDGNQVSPIIDTSIRIKHLPAPSVTNSSQL
jgi:hypothetical protein